MSIFIGGAWAYANGSLHLGHLSSLLPGDILARYYRLKGEKVLYVSGSDCNGTPITIKAKQEGVRPKDIADRYHQEFVDCFTKLGFSYDTYTRTDTVHHHRIVQEIFLELLERGHIYKKEIEQTYCEFDQQFLPDRYVEGICPNCGANARGDQCDHCSTVLEPLDLLDRKCKICGNSPTTRFTEHFYFSLSSFQAVLEQYTQAAEENHLWRENAISLTKRYLKEGLQDRAVSRDLPIGVSVPVAGYEEKKIYVWIEAVSGYYTASKLWAKENNQDDSAFWNASTVSYYVHGKDNIPFHSIIWPGILAGLGKEPLPTHIVSNEYLTLERKKLSTSKNWAVWVPDLLERYHPDSIRYFLTINAPENRDADFSWKEFIHSHNSELLGAYGNFVNRTLKFIEKSFDGVIPEKPITTNIQEKVKQLYDEVGQCIEATSFKLGLEKVFELVRFSNKYFDEQKPWKQIKEDPESCKQTLADCVYLLANLAQILAPFLPFSSNKVKEMVNTQQTQWKPVKVQSQQLSKIEPIYERIDLARIEEELERLNQQKKSQ
ncbi:methionine--tRNA ligase [Mesobacillus maritimus]|uniref:methionine--tRNA ligase n=1 Tax=Mesobacillus maritimus TaxID=1643336 RepID=UPI00203C9AAC|nr:methionine--tRNA ligase [Mesobacillus maritimus]MCM3585747.1 methionine--tRNA ligase [Mesobacillus maritimus]MCM3670502.1 methionine--tRNA ligase [Mesobacillus maritimus]